MESKVSNQKKRIKIRPLTTADIVAVRGAPLRESIKGIAVDFDGELAVIAGLVHTIPLQVISVIVNQDIRLCRRVALPIRKAFMGILEEYSEFPIYAVPDDKYPTPEVFLKFFGFEQIKEGVYQWKIQSR